MVFALNKSIVFPNPALADEDGLLAMGGDLSPARLIAAYSKGIFPWYSEGEPICWYSPHKRFVLMPDNIHVSHSMKQLLRADKYKVTCNKEFAQVMQHCAVTKRPGQRGTWITKDMIRAYCALHEMGIAHSIEVWHDDKLIGGLYGVETGNVFCGESMFSLMPDASKLALVSLCRERQYKLIDCQLHTPHLERMGGKYISREEYMKYLKDDNVFSA